MSLEELTNECRRTTVRSSVKREEGDGEKKRREGRREE